MLVVGTQRSYGTLPDEETMQGFTVRRVRYGRFGANKRRPWRWFRHGLQAVQIIRTLNATPTRAYHAHDLPALILIAFARLVRQRSTRVVYDSHELFLFNSPHSSRWANRWNTITRPFFMAIEKRLARRADAVLGLSDVRARCLSRWYGIPRPTVIYNIVDPVQAGEQAPFDLRALVGAESRCIVHTGDITNRGRALNELIDAMALLPGDCTLVFLGQGEAWPELRARAAQLGIDHRVFQVPPVPPDQVAAAISSADVGISLLRPDAYNIRASIPNKLWEAMAAGLPIVASDNFAQVQIIRRCDLGVTCSPHHPPDIARAILQALREQAHYRACITAAQRGLPWQAEAEKLCRIYRDLLA